MTRISKNIITDMEDILDELVANHGEDFRGVSTGVLRMTFSRREDDLEFSVSFGAKRHDAEDDE